MKTLLTVLTLIAAQVGIMYLFVEFNLSSWQLFLTSIAAGGLLGLIL